MGQKILIADDSAHVRMLVRHALADRGYDLIEAVSGADALQKVIDEKPDLILLDLTMPEIDGFEVIRSMRRLPDTSGTKIMMLTSSGEMANVKESYDLGAVGYIMKPVQSDDLATAVAKALTPTKH
jgi:two-component system chemotaxis response regulator CheY